MLEQVSSYLSDIYTLSLASLINVSSLTLIISYTTVSTLAEPTFINVSSLTLICVSTQGATHTC